jgi:ribosomal protein L21E
MESGEVKATAVAVKFNGTISELCELLEKAKNNGENIKVSYCGKTFYSLLSNEYIVYTLATGYSKEDFESFFVGKQIIDPAVSRKQAKELFKGAVGQVYSDRKSPFDMLIEAYAKIGKIEVASAIIECIKLANTKRQDACDKIRTILAEFDEVQSRDILMIVVENSKRGDVFLKEFDPQKAEMQESYLRDLSVRNTLARTNEDVKRIGKEIKSFSR